MNFLSEVGRRLNSLSGDPCETSFLFQRLSMIAQHFNSVLIMHSFCSTDENPDLWLPVIFVFSFLFLTPAIYTTTTIYYHLTASFPGQSG